MVDHLRRVTEEFARQVRTFDAWAEKADDQVATRFGAYLGECGRGDLLDVACGSGVVSAAIAAGAASVIGLDATEEMLDFASGRCAKAGLTNVAFQKGDAEDLPFVDGQFDGVVTRAAIHHFADPQRALREIRRVLRPGGTAVIVDVVSSEDASESELHNALEKLRDPSHVRMLSASELERCVTAAGLGDITHDGWHMPRNFEEWMSIVNDPARAGPVRTIARELAQAGRTAGIGLSIQNGQLVFYHRWRLLRAR